jgi:transmembrane sensor
VNQRGTIREQVLEEAAGWLIECQAGGLNPEQRAAFDAWLRAAPENVCAYLSLLPLWESSAMLDATQQPDTAALIHAARGASTNVIPLDCNVVRENPHAYRPQRQAPRSVPTVRGFLLGAMAAVLAIAMVAGSWLYTQRNVYSTTLGEQRALTLNDGTVVELNARSRIDVRYTGSKREVELLSGQALFRVAHDAGRPFVVHSEKLRIRALGTQFDVYRKPGDTTITVIEGRVSVDTGGGAGSSAAVSLLSAGQQVSIRADVQPRAVSADVSRAIAWTQRRMIFSATPLEEVAREFNRYNARQLIVDSPELSALRVNGVFSSTDLDTLLAFLREQPGVVVDEGASEIRITHR